MTDDIIDLSQYSDRVIHETKVDFSQRIIVKPIHIMQYDNNLPIIAVSLYDNGSQYNIPEGAKVFVRWSKKDHKFIRKEVLGIDAARQTAYFEVSSNMAFYYGTHNPILEVRTSSAGFPDSEAIIAENDKVAGSSYMLIEIDRNPIQVNDIKSETEFIDLDQYVSDASQHATDAYMSAESAQQAATDAADSARSATVALEQIGDAVERATNQAVISTNAANNAQASAGAAANSAASATSASQDASTYAQQASASAQSAEQSKEYVEEYKEQAVEAIREAADAEITRAQEIVSQAINTFEIGEPEQTVPSDKLIVGGIFYKKL